MPRRSISLATTTISSSDGGSSPRARRRRSPARPRCRGSCRRDHHAEVDHLVGSCSRARRRRCSCRCRGRRPSPSRGRRGPRCGRRLSCRPPCTAPGTRRRASSPARSSPPVGGTCAPSRTGRRRRACRPSAALDHVERPVLACRASAVDLDEVDDAVHESMLEALLDRGVAPERSSSRRTASPPSYRRASSTSRSVASGDGSR